MSVAVRIPETVCWDYNREEVQETVAQFIPAGRTSVVKRGETMLQVQTEYAYRPYPRITTTILNSGQVLHKLEKKLDHPIASVEEQNLAESVIKRQHTEVMGLVSGRKPAPAPERDETVRITRADLEKHMEAERARAAIEEAEPPAPTRPLPEPLPESIPERCARIPDFENVYVLTIDGLFKSDNAERQFRKAFPDVYKSIREVVEVFPEKRGKLKRRDEGVFEVQRNRLYLASSGDELVFVSVQPSGEPINYEKIIKDTLMPDELALFLQQKNSGR